MATIAEADEQIPASPEVTEMFKAGLHFGYTRTRRHPKMRPFIFGTKSNIEVFDLTKIHPKLTEALDFVRELGKENKTILLVGSKACAKGLLEATAKDIGMPYISGRWLGGTLTNFKVISERIQHWQELKRQQDSGELKKYKKHEQLNISKEIEKLEYVFGGIESMKKLPQAMLVIDLNEEILAVKEAKKKQIPVVALTSSDTDPSLADYAIPANDNSKASIEYVLDRMKRAYREGQSQQPPKQEQTQ